MRAYNLSSMANWVWVNRVRVRRATVPAPDSFTKDELATLVSEDVLIADEVRASFAAGPCIVTELEDRP